MNRPSLHVQFRPGWLQRLRLRPGRTRFSQVSLNKRHEDTLKRRIKTEMEYKSLGKIIVDVLAARKWCNSIGISTDGTRLDEIEHYLDEVLNPTTLEANPFRDDPLGTDAYYALSDGAGFGRIAAELSRFPSHQLPRQTLRDVLKGSLAASKEDRDPTTDPRNEFVELELAAHCSAAGFSVIGFDDLKFEFEGQLYIVECKRPSHSGTLDRNMERCV